ncbi:hypothetical protein SprV_0702437500 [Sparganum proliferum]
MREARDRQIESLALSDSNPGKSVANIFRHRSSSKRGHELPPLLNDNKVFLTDDTDKAELFSAFFAKHFATESDPVTFFRSLSDRTLSTIDVSSDLIKKHIRRLKNSHCSGTDGIPNSIIKQASDLPILLSHLFSVYISKGFFPERWKTSIIIPVFKSGSRSDVNNYRGVHKTPSLAKLLERIIFNEILDFCLANRLLSSSQHGFLPKRSCETCHLAFLNLITSLRNEQQAVVVIYFDLSKAFDKVPHRRLLVKLEALGIRPPLLDFIRSYLSNRYQKVMVVPKDTLLSVAEKVVAVNQQSLNPHKHERDFQSESPLPVTSPVYPQSVAPTTLERSLASISHVNGGPDIPSFTTPASLKQKKKPKKKKKSTNSAFADGDTDEDENPWMPVSSKKTKITKTQANKETIEPTETPSAPVNVDVPEKKKRKRKSDKKTLPASVISPEETSQQHVSPVPPQVAPVSATPAVPSSQSVSSSGDVEPAHSKQPRRKATSLRSAETPGGGGVVQHGQVDHTKPDAATVKAPPSQKTLLNYAQELEFLVAEALGLETLVSTRTRFTELALPDLSAVAAAPTALSATQLPPDVIQLRAHLRAKEAECQVLRDEVVRMHSDIIALKTAALSAASAPPPPPPQPAQEKPQPAVKVTCASKSVQSEPVPQETASSRPSDIVIMTLQEEIGRLAKESTIMSQRNAVIKHALNYHDELTSVNWFSLLTWAYLQCSPQ